MLKSLKCPHQALFHYVTVDTTTGLKMMDEARTLVCQPNCCLKETSLLLLCVTYLIVGQFHQTRPVCGALTCILKINVQICVQQK